MTCALLLQETVLEVLRQGWKDTEEADKGKPPGESAFEQKRFAADWWDGALRRKTADAVLGRGRGPSVISQWQASSILG